VRDCYTPLYDLAMAQIWSDGMCIVGSPGVGKSCFLDYALHRLRELGNSIMYICGKKYHTFIYQADGVVEKF
jgi:hypothetical protein